MSKNLEKPVRKSDEEWRRQLSAEQYHVTREGGTERAFTGEYCHHKGEGMYHCVCCGAPLFNSDHKFDSGTGWPSFYQPASPGVIGSETDNRYAQEPEIAKRLLERLEAMVAAAAPVPAPK